MLTTTLAFATLTSHARPVRQSCRIFPANNPINQEIAKALPNPNSAKYIASIGLSAHLHPDFGTNPSYGIPYSVVGPRQPKVPIHFTAYGEESNPGPYPIPPGAPVEGAGAEGDRHVLVLQEGTCRLYEMYGASRSGAGWDAASARSLISAQTRSDRTAGLQPTRRGFQSSRCWRAMKTCAVAVSIMPCA